MSKIKNISRSKGALLLTRQYPDQEELDRNSKKEIHQPPYIEGERVGATIQDNHM
jgi:hypothetical protein